MGDFFRNTSTMKFMTFVVIALSLVSMSSQCHTPCHILTLFPMIPMHHLQVIMHQHLDVSKFRLIVDLPKETGMMHLLPGDSTLHNPRMTSKDTTKSFFCDRCT